MSTQMLITHSVHLCSFAAFIITTSEAQQAQEGIVVAFGTGNHILPKTEIELCQEKDKVGR